MGALLVVGLLGARTLRGTPLPGDGTLAVPAYGLLPRGTDASPLSPDGLAATHTAAYAALTRAFGRHATLIGAEREVLLVAVLIGALLGWRAARRRGIPDPACAVGLLGLAAALAVFPLAAVATPAALAVPWAALAGYLATLHRPPPVALGFAAAALVPAVLLGPDLLLVVVAGAGTALAVRARATGGPVHGAVATVATLLALVAVRLALPSWHAEPTDTARWAGSTTALAVLGVALLLVAVSSGLLLPALRPVAAGLLALTVLVVVPPSSRVPALVLALPLAALLLAGSATGLRRRWTSTVRAPVRRPAAVAAAVALAAAVVLAGAGLAAAPRDDFGAAGEEQLLAWALGQLPADARLVADPALAAELRQAGASAGLLDGGAGKHPAKPGPVLRVARGETTGGALVVARFTDGDGPPLTVVDPAATAPDPVQLDRWRRLGAALTDNPRTQLPDAATGLLRDGAVDPRLLTLLAGIVARFGVQLADLSPVPGEESPFPVRSAVLTAPDLSPLQNWLAAQQPPLAPEDVRLVEGGLLVGFRYVTDPEGAVTGSGG